MSHYSNYILLEDRDAVFCYIPKVACTNWKCCARRLSGQPDWLNPRLAHDKVRSGLVFLDPTEKSHALRIQQSRLRLSMVRNPYSRVLAAYLDKIVRNQQDGGLLPRNSDADYWFNVSAAIDSFRVNVLSPAKYGSMTFEVFLLWLKHSEHKAVNNEHWVPQSNLMMTNVAEPSFIGRFETLSADSSQILEILGAGFSFPSQQDLNFPPTSASEKLGIYYSLNCISLVNCIFAKDFDVFGYERATSLSELVSKN